MTFRLRLQPTEPHWPGQNLPAFSDSLRGRQGSPLPCPGVPGPEWRGCPHTSRGTLAAGSGPGRRAGGAGAAQRKVLCSCCQTSPELPIHLGRHQKGAPPGRVEHGPQERKAGTPKRDLRCPRSRRHHSQQPRHGDTSEPTDQGTAEEQAVGAAAEHYTALKKEAALAFALTLMSFHALPLGDLSRHRTTRPGWFQSHGRRKGGRRTEG